MFEDSLTEYETIIDTDQGMYDVLVYRVGGGTLGKFYSGSWNYRILKSGVILEESLLSTGMRQDHKYVAQAAIDFYEAEL